MNEPEEIDSPDANKAPKRPARHRGAKGGRPSRKPRTQNNTEERGSFNEGPEITVIEPSTPLIEAFRNYQVSLDSKHDKYERLVKKSRDVTIESKRVIFLLHRITNDAVGSEILSEAEEKLSIIRKTSLQAIAEELENEDIFQYLRAFSPGLQEYVEAVTFFNYMKSESISTLEDIEKDLEFEKGERSVKVPVPPAEYMLGIADLTGELMRKGINSVAQGNMEVPFKLSVLLKNLYEGFTSLGMAGKEISRKTRVLKQSLEKVERACYNINVRGSEIPKHMLTDIFGNEPSSPRKEPEPNIF